MNHVYIAVAMATIIHNNKLLSVDFEMTSIICWFKICNQNI